MIDWEAIKKWNPTREIIRACIAWGGIGGESSSYTIFDSMLKAYVECGGQIDRNHIEAALNGQYGNIINWLLYNLDLICKNEINDNTLNQIKICLDSGFLLTNLHHKLVKRINKHS